MSQVIRMIRSVPPRDWSAVMAAALVAVGVEVGLRTLGLQHLARMVGAPLGSGAVGDPGTGCWDSEPPVLRERDRRRVRATRRVMRHWAFGDTCLRQALVSGHRLRHLGPTLQVGVAKIDGEVRAHAWLEIRGTVLDPMHAAESYLSLTPVTRGGAP